MVHHVLDVLEAVLLLAVALVTASVIKRNPNFLSFMSMPSALVFVDGSGAAKVLPDTVRHITVRRATKKPFQ
ncbi:hypothetical protein PG987_001515 [Apiospora arundinis]